MADNIMKKITIYIEVEQWDQLNFIQDELGISKSEFIRRSIDVAIHQVMIPMFSDYPNIQLSQWRCPEYV